MTLTQVKKIGYELTGLEITTKENQDTCFVFGMGLCYININSEQLQFIFNNNKSLYHSFGIINEQGIYLQALLHEIAHYKHYVKFGNKDYLDMYINNRKYFKKVASRYSTRYYKRFVKNTKVSNMALDKIKVI